ncbi:acyl-ACP--UDP-N-acetylglucosamine O-acyltransferase [Marinobacter sp.]|uniref:acyl-ACP--UDP-N-acetylglucosamine O-acyltransferase n=1 Tax=Marinobacter sp. TaxID=50741 RepID=UPI0038512E6D
MDSEQIPLIHDTAIVDPSARLAGGVVIGAYAVIGAGVDIQPGTTVGPHSVIYGPTRLGRNNRIHPHVCLGGAPQDLGYLEESTRLEIGDGNTIREFVTIHRGTPKDRALTTIGNDNLLMAYAHVGHDCVLGNNIVMANGATLAGHVSVGDRANIAGLVAVHQFARIGQIAMVGGGSIVVKDIPPFMLAAGNTARLYGLNHRGLKRAGLDAAGLAALKSAYRTLYRSGLGLKHAIRELESQSLTPEVQQLLDFLKQSKRGLSR